MSARVLVVDDERRIREVVQYALQREGYQVLLAETSQQATRMLATEAIDLVVLDVMLPDGSGLDLCRRVRAQQRVPILFLSAKAEEIDRVLGLELGADDYLAKPFGTRELLARVKAVLRRTQDQAADSAPTRSNHCLQVGALKLDIERHEVLAEGTTVDLTHTEFRLLQILMQRPGIVYERGHLMRQARNDDCHITERTVDTHIRRIRQKLREVGLAPIATVHGVGYKLVLEGCVRA